MKPSTPSRVALLPQLRLPPVDGFPARTSTCARVGTGVVGVSVPQARAWLSLSLSQAPANPRPPASTDRAGASRRGAAAAGATHLQSALGQLLRAWSSSTGEVTGSAAPAAAGAAGSFMASAQAGWLSSSATVRRRGRNRRLYSSSVDAL